MVAPANGSLKNILKEEGDVVLSDEVLAVFVEGDVAEAAPAAPAAEEVAASESSDDAMLVLLHANWPTKKALTWRM